MDKAEREAKALQRRRLRAGRLLEGKTRNGTLRTLSRQVRSLYRWRRNRYQVLGRLQRRYCSRPQAQISCCREFPSITHQAMYTLCSSIALDDAEDRVLAKPEPVAYFSVRLAFTDKL
jgi:hypothetical protein